MSYWRLYYHIVWATKGREPLVRPEFAGRLYNEIAAKGKRLGALVHAVGGTPDHVHVVASVPPGLALGDFIGQMKGASSHLINHELALGETFAWQAEYGVVSFGDKQLDWVVKYVQDQERHHTAGTATAALERTADEQG